MNNFIAANIALSRLRRICEWARYPADGPSRLLALNQRDVSDVLCKDEIRWLYQDTSELPAA